jgi:predicted nuclease of predicted toxin-antitoxin system
MRVLLDTSVAGHAKDALEEASYQVEWVGDWPQDPGDADILRYAHDNGIVLVTLDKDFGQLAVVQGLPHTGIIRLVGVRPRNQGAVALQALVSYAEDLRRGAILTVEQYRVRVRPGREDNENAS